MIWHLFSLIEFLKSYFETNPVPEIPTFGYDTTFIVDGFARIQIYMEELSGEGSGVASAPVILLAAGVTIFLGVAGEAFFKKTGIPDIAFLMILGVIIGPVLGIIGPAAIIEIVPYFAALALIIIMFDGGLNLDFKSMAKTVHYALIIAIVGFVISMIIVTMLAHYGLGWPWLDSILLASIVGGSSSIIVFGLVRKLLISEETKSMLSFESAITDVLATIIAFILFEAVLAGHFDMDLLGETIGRAVLVGIVLGLGVGIPWMYVTTKLGNAAHVYMLSLGILFMLFFLANSFGESGALTALVFGLMLGNKRHFSKIFKFKIPLIVKDDSMHDQLTFLVRAFFFVFVGMLASFGQIEYLIFGIVATVIIYVGRIALARATLTKRFSLLDKTVTSAMIPRGLAAAVLATYPITLGLPNAAAYPQIVFVIIMMSVIITTLGLGKAKKIPPPVSQEGGFVTKPTDGAKPEEGTIVSESVAPENKT